MLAPIDACALSPSWQRSNIRQEESQACRVFISRQSKQSCVKLETPDEVRTMPSERPPAHCGSPYTATSSP
eukprot:4637688-Amphidinium_carterae.1